MEHLESNGISDAELFIHAIPHFEGSPGVVIDEERALNSPCTGYKADGKEILVFSEGVIGNLDKEQREKFCTLGTSWKTSPAVSKRYTKFKEAIKAAKGKYKNGDITKWLELVGEEMRKKGVHL